MGDVAAKLRIKGKVYEILVDLDKALEVRKGKGSVKEALLTEAIFHNIKSGEKAPEAELKSAFGTEDIFSAAEKIIKSGEIEIPTSYKNKERGEKLKQVIDFLVKNVVDPRTDRPYTPNRIEESINQAGINIENKAIEEQLSRVLEKLRTVLPIKIETKKLSVKVPSIYTGRVYGLLNEYKEREDWLNNGDLIVVINIPVGMQMDFYDKLNSVTHGAAVAEEMKEK